MGKNYRGFSFAVCVTVVLWGGSVLVVLNVQGSTPFCLVSFSDRECQSVVGVAFHWDTCWGGFLGLGARMQGSRVCCIVVVVVSSRVVVPRACWWVVVR